MLSQSTARFCQAREFSSFSTALYVRFSFLQFCKAFSVLKARHICRVTHACSFDESRKGFFRYRLPPLSYAALNTGRYHRKERFASYGEQEIILRDETAKFSASSLGASDGRRSRKSRVKLRSAVSEYILDEDGFLNIEDLVDFLKRESGGWL